MSVDVFWGRVYDLLQTFLVLASQGGAKVVEHPVQIIFSKAHENDKICVSLRRFWDYKRREKVFLKNVQKFRFLASLWKKCVGSYQKGVRLMLSLPAMAMPLVCFPSH